MFSNLAELVLEPAASKDEIRAVLRKACNVATGEYGKIRDRRSMLPECVVLFERLGRNLWLYISLCFLVALFDTYGILETAARIPL